MPVYVFLKIGNNAYTTNAIIAGTRPIPNIGIINPNNANDGMVCNIAAIFITTSDNRFVFVKAIPNGTAIKIAISSAINEIWICSKMVVSTSPLRSLSVLNNSLML